MSRNIIVEECLKNSYKSRATKPIIGLIIGQRTSTTDYVVHLTRTPEENSDEGNSSAQNETWQPDLIIQHAKQVTRMLPGGFDVIGVFVTHPSANLPPNIFNTLKSLIIKVFAEVDKLLYTSLHKSSDKLLVHIPSDADRWECKYVNTVDLTSSQKSIDIKFLSDNGRWLRLESNLAIDFKTYMPTSNGYQALINHLQISFNPLCEEIKSALCLINGEMKSPNCTLVKEPVFKGKKGKSKNVTVETSHQMNYMVDLFVEKFTVADTHSQEMEAINCNVKLQIKGTIKGRAYINKYATFEEATKVLKLDFVRSLMSRCEIHCEDLLVIDDEQQDRLVVHEPPFRVFAPLPGINVTVSDYLFPGEKAEDSLEAIEELLDIRILANDIEAQHEHTAKSKDLTPLVQETVTESESFVPKNSSSNKGSYCDLM